VNKHLYFCHPLVLSSPTLMMHGHMNLKFGIRCICWFYSQGTCYDARSYDHKNKKYINL